MAQYACWQAPERAARLHAWSDSGGLPDGIAFWWLQAWGLLELQRGNVLAAVLLLERCVANDPRCSPVLKWKPVKVCPSTLLRRSLTLDMAPLLNIVLIRVSCPMGLSLPARSQACERMSDAMLGVSFTLHLNCVLRVVQPS